MGDREAEASRRDEHPRNLGYRPVQLGDILRRHKGDSEVRPAAFEWQVSRIRHHHSLAATAVGHAGRGPRAVDRDNAMPSFTQQPPEWTRMGTAGQELSGKHLTSRARAASLLERRTPGSQTPPLPGSYTSPSVGPEWCAPAQTVAR